MARHGRADRRRRAGGDGRAAVVGDDDGGLGRPVGVVQRETGPGPPAREIGAERLARGEDAAERSGRDRLGVEEREDCRRDVAEGHPLDEEELGERRPDRRRGAAGRSPSPHLRGGWRSSREIAAVEGGIGDLRDPVGRGGAELRDGVAAVPEAERCATSTPWACRWSRRCRSDTPGRPGRRRGPCRDPAPRARRLGSSRHQRVGPGGAWPARSVVVSRSATPASRAWKSRRAGGCWGSIERPGSPARSTCRAARPAGAGPGRGAGRHDVTAADARGRARRPPGRPALQLPVADLDGGGRRRGPVPDAAAPGS